MPPTPQPATPPLNHPSTPAPHPPQGKLSAIPMPEAIDTLAHAWSVAYKALGGGGAAGISTADLLTGRGSTFGAGIDNYRQSRAAASAAASAAAAADARARTFGGVMNKAANRLQFGGKGSSGKAVGDNGAAVAAGAAPVPMQRAPSDRSGGSGRGEGGDTGTGTEGSTVSGSGEGESGEVHTKKPSLFKRLSKGGLKA